MLTAKEEERQSSIMKADQNTEDQKPAAEMPGVKPAENGKTKRQKVKQAFRNEKKTKRKAT